MRTKKKQSIEQPYYEKPLFIPIQGMTDNQSKAIKAIKNNTITFLTGYAGTGKTYLATGVALESLLNKDAQSIIVTRPVCEVGRNLGALPNGLDEKYAPYIEPIIDSFNKQINHSHVKNLVRNGRIDIKPLEFMRGKTFDNCIVICDEAQNTTPEQMKMLLTRIGKNCKMIITGDTQQSDLKQRDGLTIAVNKLHGISSIRVVEFELTDIVRNDIIGDSLRAWS
jgi:phosphate starvation-inducible PhoH-like protein